MNENQNKNENLETTLQEPAVSVALLSAIDYWKQRCLLAEKILKETPCDSDIHVEQINAWGAYNQFLSWAGNDR